MPILAVTLSSCHIRIFSPIQFRFTTLCYKTGSLDWAPLWTRLLCIALCKGWPKIKIHNVLKLITTIASGINRVIVSVLVGFVRAYRLFLAPILPRSCRFYPSCSHYAEEALKTHGPVRGCWLSIVRICKCHPWHSGGYDPVPPRTSCCNEITPGNLEKLPFRPITALLVGKKCSHTGRHLRFLASLCLVLERKF